MACGLADRLQRTGQVITDAYDPDLENASAVALSIAATGRRLARIDPIRALKHE